MQRPTTLLGFANRFFRTPHLGFFLQIFPYALPIVVLVTGSREAMRERLGAPAALGVPYVRSEKV